MEVQYKFRYQMGFTGPTHAVLSGFHTSCALSDEGKIAPLPGVEPQSSDPRNFTLIKSKQM